MKASFTLALCLLAVLPLARAGTPPALAGLEAIQPSIDALYVDLHRNPELSLQEEKTAAKLAARLRESGYEVSERVGGHGVVGVLRNGAGPVVMVRTDLDALPIREATGLPYASTVEARNAAGDKVPVMHACGHDVHMASWVGAATLLARERASWRGTLVFIGQPAEEILNGAAAMIDDGLMTRFPKPDAVLGLHVSNLIPAGQVGVPSGPASAASNGVDITIHGRGGHGAAPHLTVDPLLIAARTVVTLQTIVAREVNPLDPAVVTVGTLHAGTKRNIIPDDATLQLTVRSYKPEVQQQLLRAIQRIAPPWPRASRLRSAAAWANRTSRRTARSWARRTSACTAASPACPRCSCASARPSPARLLPRAPRGAIRRGRTTRGSHPIAGACCGPARRHSPCQRSRCSERRNRARLRRACAVPQGSRVNRPPGRAAIARATHPARRCRGW